MSFKGKLLGSTSLRTPALVALLLNFVVVGQAAVSSSTLHDIVAGPPKGCSITGKAPDPPLLPECPQPVQHQLAIIPVSGSSITGTLTYNMSLVSGTSGIG
jgi:hypothetical protein